MCMATDVASSNVCLPLFACTYASLIEQLACTVQRQCQMEPVSLQQFSTSAFAKNGIECRNHKATVHAPAFSHLPNQCDEPFAEPQAVSLYYYLKHFFSCKLQTQLNKRKPSSSNSLCSTVCVISPI